MTRASVLISIIVAATSCKEITFTHPQPKGKKNLSGVPLTLQGKYLTQKEEGDYSSDTIIISANGYRFGYFNPSDKTGSQYAVGVLSDSMILRTYRGYYFLNINEQPEWILRVIKQQANGDLIYMVPEQSGVDFKHYLKKLSSEIRIDSINVNGENLYQINPSPAKLITLIEKGYFSRTVLKKIR